MLAEPRQLSRRALALVLAGGRGSRLHALTDRRAKPAVYFGGKFRIIDFALSNCLNSGMRRIGVLTHLYRLLEEDAADSGSDHDFGKNLIPKAVGEGQAFAHPFSISAIANPPYSKPYWRDVGTVDAYWAANLDLASTTPELNMYDRTWPIWTYQEQLPPAKFVHAQEASGRVGMAIESLVSGGCIISGASVRNSVLFSNVLVRSYSKIDRAGVLPEGLVISEDATADAQHFHRTPSGVVLVTRPMLDKLN